MIHHPEFLSVLPFGGRFRCCVGLRCCLRLWLGLGFWDLKMLGDCIIIHDVPCVIKNSLSLKTCTNPQTPLAAFAQTMSARCSPVEGSAPDPLESELPSPSRVKCMYCHATHIKYRPACLNCCPASTTTMKTQFCANEKRCWEKCRGTTGWFLRTAVLGHGGGGG